MAYILYKTGNLLNASEHLLLHGTNSLGVMGRGVAVGIKEKFPWAFEAYRKTYIEKGLKLGSVVWAINIAPHQPQKIIGNLITQEYWQKEKAVDGRNVDYDALRSCFQEVNRFVEATRNGTIKTTFGKIFPVAMPLIGAGLAGGDWSIIKDIIEEESKCFMPVVF